jgi:hypothetical protein
MSQVHKSTEPCSALSTYQHICMLCTLLCYSASDGILDDLQVEDAVKGEGWKHGVLCFVKLELVPRSIFATLQPCPPHHQPVEVAFIGEDKLLRAVLGIDDGPELLSIQLILLQCRPCDLQYLIVSILTKKKRGSALFSQCNSPSGVNRQLFALMCRHHKPLKAHSVAPQEPCWADV